MFVCVCLCVCVCVCLCLNECVYIDTYMYMYYYRLMLGASNPAVVRREVRACVQILRSQCSSIFTIQSH